MATKLKKSTGPRTPKGKQIVSQNALIHGATSTRLINATEQEYYEQYVANLQQVYPDRHPLVAMQIDRVAKLYIQLNRIQCVLDAQFEQARNSSTITQKLAEKIGLDTMDQLNITLGKYMNTKPKQVILDGLKQSTLIAVDQFWHLQEVSSDDLFDRCPELAHYLHHECQQHGGKHINQVLNDLINQAPTDSYDIRQSYQELQEQLSAYTGQAITPAVEKTLEHLNGKLLKRYINWYIGAYQEVIERESKYLRYELELPTAQLTAMPEPEMMDRLMRYQTSLQRQLSTCMGELIALHRKPSEGATQPPQKRVK